MKVVQSLITFCFFSLSAAATEDTWQYELTGGVLAAQQPWKGISADALPFGDIRADYGRWAFGGEGVLVQYRLGDDNSGFKIVPGIGYRDEGYGQAVSLGSKQKSTALVFDGYKPPEEELLALLEFEYDWLNMQIAQDISNGSNGTSVSFSGSYPLFQYEETMQLYVSAGVLWRSANYSNALYGIAGSNIDMVKGRKAYQLESTTNPFVSVDYFYAFTEQWTLHAGLSYEQLDDAIQRSPLVDKSDLATAMLTITYR